DLEDQLALEQVEGLIEVVRVQRGTRAMRRDHDLGRGHVAAGLLAAQQDIGVEVQGGWHGSHLLRGDRGIHQYDLMYSPRELMPNGTRLSGNGETRTRTGDTTIFSRDPLSLKFGHLQEKTIVSVNSRVSGSSRTLRSFLGRKGRPRGSSAFSSARDL